MYQDHTTARALTNRYRTNRPSGRKAKRNRPPGKTPRRAPVGRPATGPIAAG